MKPIYLLPLLLLLALFSCHGINEYTVESYEDIDLKKCRVELQNLVIRNKPVSIFKEERIINIPTEYGENDWLFTYNDSLFAQYRQFIMNRNDRFVYRFSFIERKGTLYVDYLIKGKNTDFIKEGCLRMSTKRIKSR